MGEIASGLRRLVTAMLVAYGSGLVVVFIGFAIGLTAQLVLGIPLLGALGAAVSLAANNWKGSQ